MANSGSARKSAQESGTRTRGRRPLSLVGGSDAEGAGVSQDLDALIHHRVRLGIVSALAGADSLSFNALKTLLKITDGNLSVHARKLELAGYIQCNKSFEDRRPHTEYVLAAQGRKALQRYLNHMEALIETTRNTMVD